MTEFQCSSLEDTKTAAEYFATLAKSGQCFALYGDLGYGKTTFSAYLIKALNPAIENVTSPTFTIVQTYDCLINNDKTEIWHVDCYRLKDKEEFYELGLEEAIQYYVTIIEWPEIIQDLLPKNTIKIRFSLNFENQNTRIITIE